jgi:hypothetical protein
MKPYLMIKFLISGKKELWLHTAVVGKRVSITWES